MKRILQSTVVAVAVLTNSLVALAADLPERPTYSPVEVRPSLAVPTYNWTGFYFGVNGGYGWGQQDPLNLFTNKFDSISVGFSGGVVGGTFGAQIQSGHVLMGVEGDIDWANIKGSAVISPTILGVFQPAVNLTTKIDSVSTARMRLGYAQDNWLIYSTVGLALLGANTNVSTVGGVACTTALLSAYCSGTSRRIGAAAGAGVEYGITPNLSAKLEYLYVAAVSLEVSRLSVVRGGLNYRFGGN